MWQFLLFSLGGPFQTPNFLLSIQVKPQNLQNAEVLFMPISGYQIFYLCLLDVKRKQISVINIYYNSKTQSYHDLHMYNVKWNLNNHQSLTQIHQCRNIDTINHSFDLEGRKRFLSLTPLLIRSFSESFDGYSEISFIGGERTGFPKRLYSTCPSKSESWRPLL